eukprot:5420777-Prymnesium_polylepis.1
MAVAVMHGMASGSTEGRALQRVRAALTPAGVVVGEHGALGRRVVTRAARRALVAARRLACAVGALAPLAVADVGANRVRQVAREQRQVGAVGDGHAAERAEGNVDVGGAELVKLPDMALEGVGEALEDDAVACGASGH